LREVITSLFAVLFLLNGTQTRSEDTSIDLRSNGLPYRKATCFSFSPDEMRLAVGIMDDGKPRILILRYDQHEWHKVCEFTLPQEEIPLGVEFLDNKNVALSSCQEQVDDKAAVSLRLYTIGVNESKLLASFETESGSYSWPLDSIYHVRMA
jgi:hypothetical protein